MRDGFAFDTPHATIPAQVGQVQSRQIPTPNHDTGRLPRSADSTRAALQPVDALL